MDRKILYISRAGLPISAPGLRTFNIGSILEKIGFKIHYLANSRILKNELCCCYKRVSKQEYDFLSEDEIHFRIEDKIYSYLPEFSGGKIAIAKEILELLNAKNAFNRVRYYCEREHPYAIILYNDAYALTKRLIPYCKNNNIRLIADVTEWYEREKNKPFVEKMIVNLTDKRITRLDKKLDGVIAISHFFKEFYCEQGVNCTMIPPLMEVEESLEIKRYKYYPNEAVINFVYAGSPYAKDILFPFIRAVQAINKKSLKVRLDVVGIDGSYFNQCENINPDLESTGVFVHGRRSHEETVDIVKKADFGILFRKKKRYAKAGFSTKAAECMSVGVPMICNRIGGTDSVVQNMENGILTQTADYNELYGLLLQMIEWSNDAIIKMKQNAYSYAKKYFNGDTYIKELQTFFDIKKE